MGGWLSGLLDPAGLLGYMKCLLPLNFRTAAGAVGLQNPCLAGIQFFRKRWVS
jgi:hypothetical protein